MANVSISGTVVVTSLLTGDLFHLSYLPPSPTPEVVFPKAVGKDYIVQQRLIAERWRRLHPKLSYYMLKARVTPVTGETTPLGLVLTGGTLVDPIYHEPIPQGLTNADDARYLIPAGGANPEQFHDPIELNMAIRREAYDLELKQWGFDRVRSLIAVVPLILLDRVGITVSVGDQFQWGRERHRIEQMTTGGYWRHSVSKFYMIMNCQTFIRGS